MLFGHDLLPVSAFFGALGRLCVITETIPGSLHWLVCHEAAHVWLIFSMTSTLRKHAYSNILKFLPPKNEYFQMKNSDIFHISAQNIDCGYSSEPTRRGGSNEYPQSMFLSRDQKNNVYLCKPQFYYIKVGFMGIKIIKACFRDDCSVGIILLLLLLWLPFLY